MNWSLSAASLHDRASLRSAQYPAGCHRAVFRRIPHWHPKYLHRLPTRLNKVDFFMIGIFVSHTANRVEIRLEMATLVGRSPLFIQGSGWLIENIIEATMDSVLGDPSFIYINAFAVIFRVVVLLETIFTRKKTKGRSAKRIDEDQFNLFQSLERSLSRTGIDGRACMLRTVCEMQGQQLSQYTVLGEILTALFTPKRGPGNFMQQYLDAEQVGRNDPKDCALAYSKCPVSLFTAFRQHRDKAPGKSQRNAHADRSAERNGSNDELNKGVGGGGAKSIFGGLAEGEYEYHDCYVV